jgi:hypothetical protein
MPVDETAHASDRDLDGLRLPSVRILNPLHADIYLHVSLTQAKVNRTSTFPRTQTCTHHDAPHSSVKLRAQSKPASLPAPTHTIINIMILYQIEAMFGTHPRGREVTRGEAVDDE